MKHHNTLSIPQVAKQLRKTRNTVYRYITTNKLKHEYSIVSGKKVIRVKEQDLIRFCEKYNVSRYNNDTSNDTIHDMEDCITDTTPDTSEDIKQAINNAFLMYQKPLEEQALFVAGKLSSENQFLKERLEAFRQENELLREQVKALPDLQTIQEKEKDLIIQIEMERKEKEDLLSRGETIRQEQEEKHRKELETRNELHRQELKQARKQTEEEGKNYLATIEELKKRLEAEEKKPWYRRLFS